MIVIDSASSMPAYIQIYHALRSELERGAYGPEERMPSVRQLASELSVSRTTVSRAYEQLYAEGYVVGKDRSGYYADPHLHEFAQSHFDSVEPKITMPAPVSTGGTLAYDFAYGTLPDALFPLDAVRKIAAHVSTEGLNAYRDPFGSWELRKHIAVRLVRQRGVRCTADQVVLQSGTRDGFERLAKLFDPARDVVAVEQPGWPGAVQAFANNRFQIAPLHVEELVHDRERFFARLDAASPRLIYVTPSHQFPTGRVMPISNRKRLVEWARTHDAFIIEDDYDSEYRYGQTPIPSLQSIDQTDRVIYSGTLSKVFSPGMRLSYLVLPLRLLEAYRERIECYWCSVSGIVQNIACELFANGTYDRQVRKQVVYFGASQSLLVKALHRELSGAVELSGERAGLHIWVQPADGQDARELAERARRVGVGIYPATPYWVNEHDVEPTAFIMGYSSIPQDRIEPGVRLLAQVWRGWSEAEAGSGQNPGL